MDASLDGLVGVPFVQRNVESIRRSHRITVVTTVRGQVDPHRSREAAGSGGGAAGLWVGRLPSQVRKSRYGGWVR